MNKTGARGRHRAPVPFRPQHTYRDGCVLLGLTSGLMCAAIDEAVRADHPAAIGFFSVLLAADMWLYFNTAWYWIATAE